MKHEITYILVPLFFFLFLATITINYLDFLSFLANSNTNYKQVLINETLKALMFT